MSPDTWSHVTLKQSTLTGPSSCQSPVPITSPRGHGSARSLEMVIFQKVTQIGSQQAAFESVLQNQHSVVEMRPSRCTNKHLVPFLKKKLRCNSHPIKFTLFKCRVQWFLVHSQSRATTTSTSFKNIIAPKAALSPLAVSPGPLPQPLTARNSFCLCGCSYGRNHTHCVALWVWLLSLLLVFPGLVCFSLFAEERSINTDGPQSTCSPREGQAGLCAFGGRD